MHTAKLFAPLLILLALVLGATPARAETVNCTAITTLPAIITVQGVYCFTGNLAFADIRFVPAIDIQTDNVVLDLNGLQLDGLAAGPGTEATGINAHVRKNITIKNGPVRGFLDGINMLGGGHVVEDIRADQNTRAGIVVSGGSGGTIVRNNQVVATGGSTCCGADANAFGIFVDGIGPRVLNNDVSNTVKLGTGTATGILFRGVGGFGLAVNNRITKADRGIAYDAGTTGKYRDNLTFDVTTPFTGGTDAGNNN